jgi:hypothetical protein
VSGEVEAPPLWVQNIADEVSVGCVQAEALLDMVREYPVIEPLVADAIGGIARLMHAIADKLEPLTS